MSEGCRAECKGLAIIIRDAVKQQPHGIVSGVEGLWSQDLSNELWQGIKTNHSQTLLPPTSYFFSNSFHKIGNTNLHLLNLKIVVQCATGNCQMIQ